MASLEAVEGLLKMFDMAGLVKSHGMRDNPTEDQIDMRTSVYADVLSDISDADALASGREWMRSSRYFPTPADLRGIARPKVAIEVSATNEAARMYQRVLECNTYTPEAGSVWSYRQIAEEIGQHAADAFLAAGGHEAFAAADPVGDQFRFKRFSEAYVEALGARQAVARIGSGEASALLAGITERTKA